jgi:hypothetical protein
MPRLHLGQAADEFLWPARHGSALGYALRSERLKGVVYSILGLPGIVQNVRGASELFKNHVTVGVDALEDTSRELDVLVSL